VITRRRFEYLPKTEISPNNICVMVQNITMGTICYIDTTYALLGGGMHRHWKIVTRLGCYNINIIVTVRSHNIGRIRHNMILIILE